ncbi:trifunctional hydroxymethylpyrimidine kinase/phosphomethylpyrimidine kinase/thiaminase [Coemansia sp. Benny D115]|nr:trifunctional hydroxymethylpyrimidine kinase/phosphomethylpyrimidine kinase/thiaminase [Coemansia sp. Benny D115]
MVDYTVPQTPMAVLTIAGSDSSGGAGIQADLKTFMAHGTYGLSVITALTAQNTQEVRSIMSVPREMVEQQMEAVLEDIPVRAAKTGMLADAEVIGAVAAVWRQRGTSIPLVVDPVMVATSGRRLLCAEALDALRNELLPLATAVTPNLREAEVLLDMSVGSLDSVDAMKQAACQLGERFGIPVAVVKGGHLQSGTRVFDVVYLADRAQTEVVESLRAESTSTHGTGCTLSAAIAAGLANGLDHAAAVRAGIAYVNTAIHAAYPMGQGHGPVDHAHALRVNAVPRATPHNPHPFTEYLKQETHGLWQQYIGHAFVRQVGAGTIKRSSFTHYLKQDYIYLKHYARAAALSAYKSDGFRELASAATSIQTCVRESALHVHLCEQWGIAREQMEAEAESVGSVAYTRYILDRGMAGDLLELLVAMYPCLLGYGEAAAAQAGHLASVREGNEYWPWVESYAGDEFQGAVAAGRRVIEDLARREMPGGARLERLAKTFRDTTRLEILFWDSALAYGA